MEADSPLTPEKIEAILEMRRHRAAIRVPDEGEGPAMGKRISDFDPRKPNRLNKQQMNMISGFFEKATEALAKKIIAAKGGKVLGEEYVGFGLTDYSDVLRKCMAANRTRWSS